MHTRPVLRIFISSTAVDLRDYRDKVRDAVLRIENLPIAMETFSAESGYPAIECMKMAAGADAVICIVAHRYGYVPSKELGGDGERSITWLEVDAATRAGKPVFVFIVDPKAPWTEPKEQDRLTSESADRSDEIVRAVQKLREFKTYLENGHIRNSFSNVDELAKLVIAALVNLWPEHSSARSHARVWEPLYCYALQPAQHFRGREDKLHELTEWLQSPVTPDRIVSVVAAGGSGKTALVEKAVRQAILSDRAGFFVWSFYEDPHTDAFLRAAFLYFTGERDAPTGGLLERLQMALSGDSPHVLVLDGLERLQSEGDRRRRGEMEDIQLRRLLRALAGSGNTRVLVTSRFPLVDLESFTGSGHRPVTLDDLERSVAIDVLRAWKVGGDDSALARLLEPLSVNGHYHALSVAVLGSYIGNFLGGDINRASEFSILDAEETDPKAGKLHRILQQYAKVLSPIERDLLARLSLFPRGVKAQLLGWIVQSGGEVAGALVGLKNQQLVNHLERLKTLGLVFSYEFDRQGVYSAHPFLREFFRNLLGTKPESVHECVRANLAPNLDARPRSYPTDSAILDQYELLIEQTLLAGRVAEAFDLYWHGMGAYANLGWVLGAFNRGARVLERFVPGDDFSQVERQLPQQQRARLVNGLGLFSAKLGDLERARVAFVYARDLSSKGLDPAEGSMWVQNLVDVELNAGRFPQAAEYSRIARLLAIEARDEIQTRDSAALEDLARFCLGEYEVADSWRAAEPWANKGNSFVGAEEAECKFLRGDLSGARSQAQTNLEHAILYGYNTTVCRCNVLLSQIVLSDLPALASRQLQEARVFAYQSGHIELQLRCFRAACTLHMHVGNYTQAIAEAEAGIILADTCGFGRFSIDLRVILAKTLLGSGNAREALQNARFALDRSEAPECSYAWGQADSLHFCGIAHLQLDERDLARMRLEKALELRERIGHGSVEETRSVLLQIDR